MKDYLSRNVEFIKSDYFSLAPSQEEEYDKNVDLLVKMIDGGKTSNIGIVSGYGAGKSSFIETFIAKKKYNYERISIATIASTKTIADVNALELLITKQLLFSKDPSLLPHSRIRRIGQTPSKPLFFGIGILLGFALLFLSFAFLFFAGSQDGFVLETWFNGNLLAYNAIKFCLLAIGGISFIVALFIFLFNSRSFSIKYKDLEITKPKDNDEKPFFTYLDEIIYFFKRSHTQVVILEDLDRLPKEKGNNAYEIFDSLRELNIILNSSNILGSGKKIVFIYACSDEVFDNDPKLKNKYFDFVFNIPPILTKENAGSVIIRSPSFEPLLNWLEDKSFIDRISVYFEEMRILKAVYNDCLLFINNLIEENLSAFDPIETFTIMTYKNIFPGEFKNLLNGTSKLDKALARIKKERGTFNAFDCLTNDVNLISSYVESGENLNFLTMVIKYGYLRDDFKKYLLSMSSSSSLSSDELVFLKNINSNVYDEHSFVRPMDTKRLYMRLGEIDYKNVCILNMLIMNDYLDNKLSDNDPTIIRNFESIFVKHEKVKEDAYVNKFVITYLCGTDTNPKKQGDNYNLLFFKRIAPLKNDLASLIVNSSDLVDDIKKWLLFDFIFALCDNASIFVAQKDSSKAIQYVQNYELFVKHLVKYDWVLDKVDAEFEDVNLKTIETSGVLITKLIKKHKVVLNKENLDIILTSYGIDKDLYLKGHFAFNVTAHMMLFSFFDVKKKDYFAVLAEEPSNSVDSSSLKSYSRIPNETNKLIKLLSKRSESAPKIPFTYDFPQSVLLAGLIYGVFNKPDVSTIVAFIKQSQMNFKTDIVSKDLLLLCLNSSLDQSIKTFVIKACINKDNCDDDVLDAIVDSNISLTKEVIKHLLGLTESKNTMVDLALLCSDDKKGLLLELLPNVDSVYKYLFENGNITITDIKYSELYKVDILKDIIGINVRNRKDKRKLIYNIV